MNINRYVIRVSQVGMLDNSPDTKTQVLHLRVTDETKKAFNDLFSEYSYPLKLKNRDEFLALLLRTFRQVQFQEKFK